jgi:hypothetical protein
VNCELRACDRATKGYRSWEGVGAWKRREHQLGIRAGQFPCDYRRSEAKRGTSAGGTEVSGEGQLRAARVSGTVAPCRQLPAPFSSRFKEPSEAVFTNPPHPGKQYNGSMMSRANPTVFSRRELACGRTPLIFSREALRASAR